MSIILNAPETTNWSRKTILVVDDDDSSRILMEEILEITLVKVRFATNGAEAVQMCKSEYLDLVLMDLHMPVMDGYKATKVIKTILPDLPVIAVSACAFVIDKERCMEAGCIDYISKPIEINRLIEKIAGYLCLDESVWS